ncbi:MULTISPECIES: YeeE/YedE family protein [unclassified Flavobacterium]|uniref:YeeE/YedE family protein n=1 Tax=unclassified Flavobacterium TaxID=196869 RepID=UPI001F12C139|nr:MULTISPECIES: YeeE/YedE thiosulfate transporter family protein [unclassified Flavobacterium]UMY65260.1 YeeE/YedE family protein [Flavobacterium sp. HJ-32-4]
MEMLSHTWPWYVSGFLIGVVMLLLIWFGKTFGMSSNLRTLCAIGGAGKFASFFRYDHKNHFWNLVVVVGAMIGGFIAVHYFSDPSNVTLNPDTVAQLQKMGIDAPNGKLAPDVLFGPDVWTSPKMLAILLVGGVLIGFGSRYAGGCTSGHAIQGLSNLQLPSLKAVIGFFVGGLIMVHFILPLLF